ncbi:MAG: hypothetical protein F4066_11145 [Chloroflexi bacterium]|nr:hypothetical protein [Chloroflexota bacterium]MYI05395.1 hypothetical protein [Chloroflexota bacterium]
MNPFRYRARIEQIWRQSGDHNPAHVRLKALNTVTRELFAPNPQAQANYALILATDPFDVARHKLRDLYDSPAPPAGSVLPPPTGGGRCPVGTEGGFPTEDQLPDEDDDPL